MPIPTNLDHLNFVIQSLSLSLYFFASKYPSVFSAVGVATLLQIHDQASKSHFDQVKIPIPIANTPSKDLSFNAVERLAAVQMGLCMSKHDNDGESSYQNMELAGGNVHLITNKQSWDEKLSQASREGKIVVANFSAAWCGPCRVIAPFYSELSEKYPLLMFLTVDVDELTELSTSYDIKATPTFFFLRDGQQIEKLVGANKPELQKKITAVSDSIGKREK